MRQLTKFAEWLVPRELRYTVFKRWFCFITLYFSDRFSIYTCFQIVIPSFLLVFIIPMLPLVNKFEVLHTRIISLPSNHSHEHLLFLLHLTDSTPLHPAVSSHWVQAVDAFRANISLWCLVFQYEETWSFGLEGFQELGCLVLDCFLLFVLLFAFSCSRSLRGSGTSKKFQELMVTRCCFILIKRLWSFRPTHHIPRFPLITTVLRWILFYNNHNTVFTFIFRLLLFMCRETLST